VQQYVWWAIRAKEDLLAEATNRLDMCQVRSRTADPCLGLASVEILGVPFCESCAREQEAYFAIGELTRVREPDDEREPWASEPDAASLTEALGSMRRGLARKVAEAGALVGSSRR
jgi:hypothetical protein